MAKLIEFYDAQVGDVVKYNDGIWIVILKKLSLNHNIEQGFSDFAYIGRVIKTVSPINLKIGEVSEFEVTTEPFQVCTGSIARSELIGLIYG